MVESIETFDEAITVLQTEKGYFRKGVLLMIVNESDFSFSHVNNVLRKRKVNISFKASEAIKEATIKIANKLEEFVSENPK